MTGDDVRLAPIANEFIRRPRLMRWATKRHRAIAANQSIGSVLSQNFRDLRPRKRFDRIDGSIVVRIELARIEGQKHAPEQFRPVLILDRYDSVEVVDDLIAKAKLKRVALKSQC